MFIISVTSKLSAQKFYEGISENSELRIIIHYWIVELMVLELAVQDHWTNHHGSDCGCSIANMLADELVGTSSVIIMMFGFGFLDWRDRSH